MNATCAHTKALTCTHTELWRRTHSSAHGGSARARERRGAALKLRRRRTRARQVAPHLCVRVSSKGIRVSPVCLTRVYVRRQRVGISKCRETSVCPQRGVVRKTSIQTASFHCATPELTIRTHKAHSTRARAVQNAAAVCKCRGAVGCRCRGAVECRCRGASNKKNMK